MFANWMKKISIKSERIAWTFALYLMVLQRGIALKTDGYRIHSFLNELQSNSSYYLIFSWIQDLNRGKDMIMFVVIYLYLYGEVILFFDLFILFFMSLLTRDNMDSFISQHIVLLELFLKTISFHFKVGFIWISIRVWVKNYRDYQPYKYAK